MRKKQRNTSIAAFMITLLSSVTFAAIIALSYVAPFAFTFLRDKFEEEGKKRHEAALLKQPEIDAAKKEKEKEAKDLKKAKKKRKKKAQKIYKDRQKGIERVKPASPVAKEKPVRLSAGDLVTPGGFASEVKEEPKKVEPPVSKEQIEKNPDNDNYKSSGSMFRGINF